MLGKELAMTGKIAHVAERKGFELALNGVMPGGRLAASGL